MRQLVEKRELARGGVSTEPTLKLLQFRDGCHVSGFLILRKALTSTGTSTDHPTLTRSGTVDRGRVSRAGRLEPREFALHCVASASQWAGTEASTP